MMMRRLRLPILGVASLSLLFACQSPLPTQPTFVPPSLSTRVPTFQLPAQHATLQQPSSARVICRRHLWQLQRPRQRPYPWVR